MKISNERWRNGALQLTDEERAAVRKGMDAARRGEFVSDEELAAFYRRHLTLNPPSS